MATAAEEASPDNKSGPNDELDQRNMKSETARLFHDLWSNVTDDNALTLFGFRRFRTTHLLNLRLLETEVDKIDHQIYQAGLSLGLPSTSADKLGLRNSRRDERAPSPEEILRPELVSKLRRLLKEYGTWSLSRTRNSDVSTKPSFQFPDQGLVSFNQIMMMETFALADNSWQASLRNKDRFPYELYKTRLVRVDTIGRRHLSDILRRSLRKYLRAFWFFIRSQGQYEHQKNPSAAELEANLKRSYQNTSQLADVLARFLIALITGALLVIPLTVLAHQSTTKAHLITISVSIILFSLLVSLLTKATNEEMMVASAAYAAVLSVFFSNNSGS